MQNTASHIVQIVFGDNTVSYSLGIWD